MRMPGERYSAPEGASCGAPGGLGTTGEHRRPATPAAGIDEACDRCLAASLRRARLASTRDSPGVGPRVGSAEAGSRVERANLRLDEGADRLFSGRFTGSARREILGFGLTTTCSHGRFFPERLGDLPDPPSVLYANGDREHLRRLDAPGVTVVGSRNPTAYGVEAARTLSRELAAAGIVVISGMAFGIDQTVHSAALEAGGTTVAVLAGGAECASPRTLRGLFESIRARGLVLSEMPPGFVPRRWSFAVRNRIMAALGRMTVVVEARARSGALITCRDAAELGRDVGAVPGPITSDLSRGTNALLADGAAVVRSVDDVLDAVCGAGLVSAAPEADRRLDGAVEALDPNAAKLLEGVESGRGAVDELVASSGNLSAVLTGLGALETLGLIKRSSDGRYVTCRQRAARS